MTRTALALRALVSVFVLVACGTDNELVPLDDGLLDPPSSTQKSPGASSSSGSPAPAPAPGSSSSSSSSSSSGAATPPEPEADCARNANYTDYTPVLGIPADASWLRLTGDELHAFYVLPGAGIARIVSTQRVSKDAAFEAGTELGDGVNQASVLSDPLPSDDGLTLRYTKNGNSVYVATRASLEAPFETGTLALDNAKSMVLARDGSIVAYARYLRYPTFMFPARWLVFGQPVGAGEHAFVLADPGVDAYPTWYESLSQQAWIARGAETLIYTWDGDWHAAGATDFRVSWTSPNGCRLYGRHDNVIVMRSRIPIPPAPVDADAGPDSGN